MHFMTNTLFIYLFKSVALFKAVLILFIYIPIHILFYSYFKTLVFILLYTYIGVKCSRCIDLYYTVDCSETFNRQHSSRWYRDRGLPRQQIMLCCGKIQGCLCLMRAVSARRLSSGFCVLPRHIDKSFRCLLPSWLLSSKWTSLLPICTPRCWCDNQHGKFQLYCRQPVNLWHHHSSGHGGSHGSWWHVLC